MLFDVVVTDGVSNRIFRNGIAKRDAKKIVKELRGKGFKAQLVTCKGKSQEAEIELPVEEDLDE